MTHAGSWRRWGRSGLAVLAAAWVGAGGSGWAQTPAAARVPPRPSDGVYDDARIFSDEQRRAAARAIAEAKADGVTLYVAAFTYIVGETIERRAERLKSAWCGDEVGLVVVVDASTSQCTYLSHVAGRDWLPSAELRRVFAESTAASVSKPTTGERLLSVVENLVPGLRAALASQRAAAGDPESVRAWVVFAGVVGACLVLVLAGWAARRLGRRVRAARPAPAFFPTVTIEPRFGGAFAGGVAAEIDFRAAGDKVGASAPEGV